ncbi:MAG: UDP-N-acetylmuramoyl-L-alanine--D-glutamate ligase [Pseudomonadota bacterium]
MKNDIKRYVVVGTGITGSSVVSYLLAQNHFVMAMDSRDLPPNAEKIKKQVGKENVCFGKFNQQWLSDADVIVLSPGIDIKTQEIQLAIKHGVEVLGDIDIFAHDSQKPYLAITGSNGKSTVATLATEILKSQGLNVRAGANLGEPALNLLNDAAVDIYVLELSSFQLETSRSIAPDVAVVLNVSEDHLDRHESLDQYFRIKMSIYDNAKYKVVPRNTQIGKAFNHVTSFGLDAPQKDNFGILQDETGEWFARGDKNLLNTNQIGLIGESGKLNVLAALALTDAYIKNWDDALQAASEFSGLSHRCELVLDKNDIQWIDDSKGTNIGATTAAINGIERPIILLLGGIHKGGSLVDLVEAVKGNVKTVIVYGQDKKLFFEALNDFVDTYVATSLDHAVTLASEHAKRGDTVLLSPACASFDMFANYEERGNEFQALVRMQEEVDGC